MRGGLAAGLGAGELFAEGLELLLLGAEARLADKGLGSGVFGHTVILCEDTVRAMAGLPHPRAKSMHG